MRAVVHIDDNCKLALTNMQYFMFVVIIVPRNGAQKTAKYCCKSCQKQRSEEKNIYYILRPSSLITAVERRAQVDTLTEVVC